MEKTCKICGVTKPYTREGLTRSDCKASGFIGFVCWDCYLVQDAARGLIKARRMQATSEGRARSTKASSDWARRYPGKATAKVVKRQAAKLQRIPPWADLQAVAAVYAEAALKGLSVDHIIALQGATFSGLHVANNLQLMPKNHNSAKGNKLSNIPESWDYTEKEFATIGANKL